MAFIAVSLLIAALLIIYKLIIHPVFISPLAAIPAARWHARICPLWILYIRWANIENRTVHALHQRYGPIVLMGPKDLSVNCYEGGLKTIYTGGFPKTEFYTARFKNYGHDPMFTMIDNKAHGLRKRLMSNIYSKSVVLASPAIRVTSRSVLLERLLPIIQQSADSESPIEVLKLDFAYAMDSFMAFQYGLTLGSNMLQDTAEREWYLAHFFSRRPYLFWPTELPTLTTYLGKVGISVVPKRCDESAEALEAWNLAKCDAAERLLSGKSPPDEESGHWPTVFATVSQKFREQDDKAGHMVDSDKPQAYPRRLEIASDMFDHNAAAIETSGYTLTWLHYEMARRPALQARLREELVMGLQPSLRAAETPKPGEVFIDFKALDSLPILDAILQETLRRWPSVPGGQPRVTLGPCTLAGHGDIPGGVRVQAAAHTLHREASVFPAPDEWRPERWTEASAAELLEMRRWFWAWGSGGRMCVGSHVATHTMKLSIAAIYSNYTTSIYCAEGIEQEEGFIGGPKGGGLWLNFRTVE